ncbi:MAG: hypothetical protein EXR59_01350 [Dehalococcoidia bacterium]|nr:hypothetical protein [Dehalococcoidia bacterium]
MKEQMVGSRLPENLIKDLELIEGNEQTDRSTTIRKLLLKATRDWKLQHFANAYAEGKLSASKAAAEAGVSMWEMLAYLKQNKVPAQYDAEEWEQDLKTAVARVPRR